MGNVNLRVGESPPQDELPCGSQPELACVAHKNEGNMAVISCEITAFIHGERYDGAYYFP